MELSINVNIPALDRFCDWLEKGATVNMAATVPVLVDVPEEPVKAEPMPGIDPEALRGPKQALQAEPVQVPTREPVPTQPEPAASPAPALTIEDLMRAAAALRDEGKLQAVTGLFPQFCVKKLSDLKPDQIPEFADHLRKMGANI